MCAKKVGQTFERKRLVNFQAFLLERLIPEALRRGMQTLMLILDKGTTHAPKRLEGWLGEQIRVNA
ncbi:MAG TPA: hypothetical protein VLH85_00925 [Levilinea sp.]|nr:hypothetical protein [Levilinea sp.]